MRKGTIFKSYELFVAAAVIAAHASAPREGFRQRDVRFLIELVTNWVELTLHGPVLEINNTQVQRYLDDLVSEGFARRLSRGKHPRYRLARTGLIELLGRIIPQTLCSQLQHFFFLFYFIRNYRPRIEKLIEEEGKQFPLALKLEVEALLDEKALVQQQLHFAQLELKKLDVRISDGFKLGALAAKLYSQNISTPDVAKEVEKLYPYELNSQKPLSELISALPEDLAKWELEIGALQRAEHIWEPSRALLRAYVQILQKLTV
jgi:hypothetical protein